jgi:asparagine synthase (glutamine-hydrolysing)
MPSDRAKRELSRMLGALCHESFYVSGTQCFEDLGVYVGWVARKGSFSDGMPLRSENGNLTLVFSGEDFSDAGTAEVVARRGDSQNGHAASYLVHLADEDPKFPDCLNGRFQGLLVNRETGSVTLFNDRYGMHRLYCHEAKDGFYFAAEAKAILKVRPEVRELDPEGIGEFISCGCVLENRTLFKGIRVLPPGSVWAFRNGALETRQTYFQPEQWEHQEVLEPEAYYQELRDVFSQRLRSYFNGGQSVGFSLTAGLDTRMILAWHKPAAGSMPCYSFGGMFRDSEDVKVARQVARARGQSHEVIPVGEQFLSRFSHYAERTVYLTDGCVAVNHSPDLYVNERAAQIAPVRMTGNYGGEVLRRVRAFKPVPAPTDLFCPELLPSVATATETYNAQLECHPLSFAVFKQAPWHHYGLLGLEETQLSCRSPYLDNDFVRTVFRAPQSATNGIEVSRRLIADGDTSLTKIRTDRTPIDGQSWWYKQAVQRYLTFTVKAEYAYDYGMPHWAAPFDGAIASFHPEKLFLGRHKFYHFRVWYRDTLSDYLRQMLLDGRSLNRPYVQRAALENTVESHITGQQNHTLAIHTLLTLELIHRLFLDSASN